MTDDDALVEREVQSWASSGVTAATDMTERRSPDTTVACGLARGAKQLEGVAPRLE